ncbi:MAG: ABC transporter substrate-binding protein [Alphaproteobacteria bacterium]
MRIMISALAAAAAAMAVAPATAQQRTLTVGAAVADAGKLDPHLTALGADRGMLNWVFNALVRIRPGQANPTFIEPDLAESWTSSPDGKEWTFKLRQGVQCHGGNGEFTSDDAAYSLKRASTPGTSAFASDFSSVAAVEAPDRYTVKITLKQPIPSLLGLVANHLGGFMVCRKPAEAAGADFAKRPIGTGPFMFVDYTPQQAVRLAANPGYFRGKPQIDAITYRYIPSDASRDLAFRTGELDMVFGRQTDAWVQRTREVPGARIVAMEPAELNMLHLNIKAKPFDDVRVRRAVAHAIDRTTMLRFQGQSVARAAVSVIPNGNLGIAQPPLPAFDPAESKRLLAEAGYPNGITTNAIQSTLPSIMSLMEVVQGQLAKGGITMRIDPVDHATYMAQIRKDLSPVAFYQAARFPVADVYLTQFFHSRSTVGTPTGVINLSHCDVADAEIEQARTEPDRDRQLALWKAAQEKIMAAVCAVPLSESLVVWAWKDTLDLGYEMVGSLNLVPHVTERARFTR